MLLLRRLSLQVEDCWSCRAWLPSLAEDNLQKVWRWKKCEAQLQWELRGREVHPWWFRTEASGRVSWGLNHLINSLSKGMLQVRVAELGVSDGGIKCSEDHSESQEKNSKRQSRGTFPRHNKTQWMRSSLETSRYRKLKQRVKDSLGMLQFVTLLFSIKEMHSN